jgi:hypothetical protein
LHGSENTEAALAGNLACRCKKAPQKPCAAVGSNNPQGKLARPPNSSKVNQFTSARRELRAAPRAGDEPAPAALDKEERAAGAIGCNRARINRQDMRGTQPSR